MSVSGLEQIARRPLSYDSGPCEGWQASPSTPSRTPEASSPKEGLERTVVLRCTAAEKGRLQATAKEAGVSVSALLRETLGLVRSRRRKPVPRVDPALVVAVARIGGNVNQIARQINRQAIGGSRQLDAVVLMAALVAIERQLANLTRTPPLDEGEPC